MDYEVEIRFQELKKKLEPNFGEDMDVQAILFLIGVNELGIGYKDFTKQEKTDLLHVAVCTVLLPHGFYEFKGRDKEEWPHFELIKELPRLEEREQQHLIKEAIIGYFEDNEYFKVSATSN